MKENNEIKSTAHSKYRCQYHIVFAPKFRRKEIYGQLRKDIGEILRKLCEQKGVEIIEAEACPDHIHMLVSIPPYISIAQFMGYLKGKSSLMIFDRHANLKYKYGSRNFWCRGYYVDTVGRNKKVIAEYIRNSIRNYISQIALDKIVLIATHIVSDIEWIAQNIIMLKHGSIVDFGSPHHLVSKMNGKVWEIKADKDDLTHIQNHFRTVNLGFLYHRP